LGNDRRHAPPIRDTLANGEISGFDTNAEGAIDMPSSQMFRSFGVATTMCLAAGNMYATTVYVGGSGSGHYATVQAAVNALPSSGGTVLVEPGTYKGQVTISKPGVSLIGQGSSASATVITDDLWAQKSNGSGGMIGDIGSSTVIVTSAAKNFYFQNLQIQNTYTQEGNSETQALALAINGDRAVGRNVRLIGRQDTFFAGANGCNSTSCSEPTRVYLYGSYIEGNVDFIFGDAALVLDSCAIQLDEHGSLGGEATITAQNNRSSSHAYLSGFVFYNSTIYSNPATGLTADYLGRPWGVYSINVSINTNMQAPIAEAGWIEWEPGTTNYLATSYYAEYGSTSAGAAGYTARKREKHAVYLTVSETAQYAPNAFLKGSDGWVPTSVN
jgi:pectin methylesterase-like acyl-CoA thioesterase